MWGIDDWASTTDTDICSIFAHCPNLQYPDIPTFTGSHDFSAIGVFIGKECSRIQTLRYSLHGFKVHDSLPHKFMDALPPQQLAEFEYNGLFSNISTLEISIATILKECRNLTNLVISYMAIWALHHYEGNIGESLELYQLDELSFGISGCELTIEPGPDP
ncbi:hypothetical protein BGX23_001970 [Mortierella sp. AD031]|nr:hypothetical protein BGX23_001970 [Mortierella sp. AD031]